MNKYIKFIIFAFGPRRYSDISHLHIETKFEIQDFERQIVLLIFHIIVFFVWSSGMNKIQHSQGF